MIAVRGDVATDHHGHRMIPAVPVLICAWPALFLATVCLLPFLSKPFNIDDPWFLTMAQQIARHPAHPMDFEICWNNDESLSSECKNAYQFASGNLLKGQVAEGYALVPTIAAGAHEWMAHLTQLVLVWIAVIGMSSLVMRSGWEKSHATTGALLLVATPPFLPMATTAMPDILATALAIVALERLLAWKSEGRWTQGAVAAIALGIVGLARPHLVLLLPLGAFLLLDDFDPRRIILQIRRKAWVLTPVLAALLLLAGLVAAVRVHYVPTNHPSFALSPRQIPSNVFTFFRYFAFPLPLAACWLARADRTGRRWVTMCLLAAFLSFLLLGWKVALLGLMVILGFLAVAGLLIEAVRKRDNFCLFLMLWIAIPIPIVYYYFLPMKYLVPCIPAVILLCFRMLDGLSLRFTRVAIVCLIVAGTGYSMLIVRADAEFAQFGKDALYKLITPHVAAGETVWYPGQYWSYWYAPLAGARLTYPGGPQPRPGDLIVVDVSADRDFSLLKRFPNRTWVDGVSHRYRFGRTMGAGAGLYSNGPWLWTLGESKDDHFDLWRID